MNKNLILTCLLAGAASVALAQENGQMYLVKGTKVVGTYPRTDVDYITFAKPDGVAQAVHSIKAESTSSYKVDCPATAQTGDKVVFSVMMMSPTYRPSDITFGKTNCTYIGHDDETYYYMFLMPDNDVELDLNFERDMHLISVKQCQNTTIVMYNSSDGWDLDPADRIYDNFMEKPVKFIWYADYGFVGKLEVTSESGDEVPCEYVTDDEEFGKCWVFTMPDEPVTIRTSATEKTDYAGRDFVGSYRGYPIALGENGVLTGAVPTFSLSLSGNTAFHASVYGSKEFAGCYAYDADNNTFAYLDEYSADVYGKKTYGVSGKWFEGGDAFVQVNDLTEDKPENMRYYFVSKNDFTYSAAASDSYGSRYLLELQRAGGNSWYYYDHLSNTVQPVTVTFASGNSIAGACEAVVTDKEGTPLFHYSRTSSHDNPIFTLCGTEAGTYTAEDGKGDDLVLDGFGRATCGSVSGTYTVSDGVVTVTDAKNEEHTYVIDTTSHSYIANAASEWDGAENFAAMVTGRYDSNQSSMGMVAISLNHDYSGNEEKGTVKVQATLTTDFYETKEIISNTASYAYDAKASQITITGLLVGTANGRSTERINITFDVSADKKTLTCNEDKLLRAVSGGDTRYINLKGLALTAR